MCATFSGGGLLALFSHSSDADGIDVAEFCTVVFTENLNPDVVMMKSAKYRV